MLRYDECTPALSALKFALTKKFKSIKVQHQSNLFNLLISDLNSKELS